MKPLNIGKVTFTWSRAFSCVKAGKYAGLSHSVPIRESSAHFLHPQQPRDWNFLFGIVWESDKSPGKIHKGNNSAVVYMLSGNHSWPQPQLHGELHCWLVQHITQVGANTLHKTGGIKTGRTRLLCSHW